MHKRTTISEAVIGTILILIELGILAAIIRWLIK